MQEPETNPNTIVFDQAALAEWVQTCAAEAALREAGAPIGQLAAARTGAIAGMISLIAPSMEPEAAFALFALLLNDSATPQTPEEPVYEDPIPESILENDSQTVAEDIESGSEDEEN